VRVAVAGGTGLVGRRVVAHLEAGGHEVAVLARSRGVDVVSGAGLDAALDGALAVVDVTNLETLRRSAAESFFSAATSHLMAAGERAGVAHHVVLSIVGIDRVDSGYYAGKRRQEELALAGPLPSSVLRATQFHEFAGQMLARTRRGPFAFVPKMRMQPVAADEVAAALASLAVGPAVGRAQDLGGPEPRDLVPLVRDLVRSRGDHVRVVPLPVPGAAGKAMAAGGLLPGPDALLGTQTFEQWLAASG
jgi:uncharacterized protein YbjT (DUF2867 family)